MTTTREIKETALDTMLHRVAAETLTYVNDYWQEYLTDNDYEVDATTGDLPDEAYGHELYLYVYQDGDWIIDHAQYLQSHRGLFACASLAHYDTAESLYQTLEADADWDVIDLDAGE